MRIGGRSEDERMGESGSGSERGEDARRVVVVEIVENLMLGVMERVTAE